MQLPSRNAEVAISLLRRGNSNPPRDVESQNAEFFTPSEYEITYTRVGCTTVVVLERKVGCLVASNCDGTLDAPDCEHQAARGVWLLSPDIDRWQEQGIQGYGHCSTNSFRCMGVRSLERNDPPLSPPWSNGHLPCAKFPRSSESEWLCRLTVKIIGFWAGARVYL
jgi:hypothetical protein